MRLTGWVPATPTRTSAPYADEPWAVVVSLSIDDGVAGAALSLRSGVWTGPGLHGHGSSGDTRYYISDVPSVSDGSWLAHVGLDTAPATACRRSGHLIAWLQAAKNNRRGEPYVGQSLIGWTDRTEGTAELVLMQTTPGTPVTVGQDLAWAAAHLAAEAGATQVTTSLRGPYLIAVGFRPSTDGALRLSTEFVD